MRTNQTFTLQRTLDILPDLRAGIAQGQQQLGLIRDVAQIMYEIGTDKPIFSDRNGIKLYDWNQLNDRRLGYAWYTYAPVLALKQYEAWARKNVTRIQ
jgi:hypothetical protein